MPLAENLGLTIEHYCDYDDVACASKAAFSHYSNASGNVLIAWEHYYMRRIAAAMTQQDVNSVHATPSKNEQRSKIRTLPYNILIYHQR